MTTMPATMTFRLYDERLEQPAAGVRVQLYWVDTHADVLLRATATNDDGGTNGALLEAAKMSAGRYKLLLHVGDYLRANPAGGGCRFLDVVVVAFVVEDASADVELTVTLQDEGYRVSGGTNADR